MVAFILSCVGLPWTLFSDRRAKTEDLKSLLKTCEVAVNLGTVLILAGLVLGGMWAYDSWGRFWGWDPKETWALILFLYYVTMIHGRYTKNRGAFWTTWMAFGGGNVLLWTYFGTNELLSGLHSYANSAGDTSFADNFIHARNRWFVITSGTMLAIWLGSLVLYLSTGKEGAASSKTDGDSTVPQSATMRNETSTPTRFRIRSSEHDVATGRRTEIRGRVLEGENVMHQGIENESTPTLQRLTRELLIELGENPERPGLSRTPSRVADSWRELTAGYGCTLDDILNDAIFEEDANEMVLVKDIEIYSLCEHHLLPFFGKCHVAYIPDGRVIGLSKLPRIVDMFARRLQVQERLTTQVANAVESVLQPLGVAVIIEASHLCMMMRGVQKQNSITKTSAMLGQFRSDSKTRAELLGILGLGA